MTHKVFHWLCLVLVVASSATAWDESELEIFDVVEEVNQNFYEFLGITQEATSSEIKRAYRQLSLVLHPDKNDAEDAEIKFRHLVAIYEILKDKEKREVYNRVLVEGLPDWRMPVFYYRRMRKMGLAECLAYIIVIYTLCQYFVLWAAYLEKRFTMQELVSSQSKKLMKKAKKGQNVEELNAALETHTESIVGPKPSVFDTLPFQLYRGVKALIFAIPTLPSTLMGAYKEAKEKKMEEERERQQEEEERQRREQEKKERKEQRQKRKKVEKYVDRTGEDTGRNSSDENDLPPEVDAFSKPANALQMWTDHDLAKLSRLMKKYPVGTQERWEKIADIMERLPWEVSKMARNVKDVGYQVAISKSAQGVTGLENDKMVDDQKLENETDEDDYDDGSSTDLDDENYGVYTVASKSEYVPVEVKTKKKTRGGKEAVDAVEDNEEMTEESEEIWSQQQQKALESALTQYPKGSAERWDRIAGKVPGKTKEQCMARFKELAEIVKKKKEQAASS